MRHRKSRKMEGFFRSIGCTKEDSSARSHRMGTTGMLSPDHSYRKRDTVHEFEPNVYPQSPRRTMHPGSNDRRFSWQKSSAFVGRQNGRRRNHFAARGPQILGKGRTITGVLQAVALIEESEEIDRDRSQHHRSTDIEMQTFSERKLLKA